MRKVVALLISALFLVGGAPKGLRLGDEARPLRQAVDITVTPGEPGFLGETDLDLAFRRPSREVWLNASELEVASATLTAGGVTQPARILDGDDQTVGFAWDDSVAEGTLHVEYHGAVDPIETAGVFSQREGDDVYVFTQFEAQDARRAFPCFDQPDIKIPWSVTLHVPAGLAVFGNAPVASDTAEGSGRKVVFAETKPLPTYLVAFAVGPFDVVEAGTSGRNAVPVRIAVPRGRAGDAGWAVETTGPLLDRLEAYFDDPYPYEKLDVVSLPVPIGFGAMENAGMITIEQSSVVVLAADDTAERRRDYVTTMAHELAHQWFGNLVTMAWWDDLWLNESFASWMGTRITEEAFPSWRVDVSRVGAQQYAFEADSLETARRLREPIVARDDIENAFDGITYAKGQAVLEMYEAWLGPDVFRAGVRQYLKTHAWGNATAEDFVVAMEEASGRPLASGFGSFLGQPGLPRISATVDCEGDPTLSLSQERWLPAGKPGKARWELPVCWRAEGLERTCTVLSKREQTVPLASCPSWIVPNDGQRGYYRVAYDEAQVAALLVAEGPDLSVPERVGVVADADALVETGDLAPSVVLGQVPSLVAMGEHPITAATIGIVAFLDQHLVPDDLHANYRRFIDKTYGALAAGLGLTAEEGEPEETTRLRPEVIALVALQGGDRALRAEGVALGERWLATRGGVDPAMVPVMLAIAGTEGGMPLFERLRDAALAEPDRERRGILLAAMGGLHDPDALRGALDFAVSGEIDLREAVGIFFGALSRPASQDVAWEWLTVNLDRVEPLVPAIGRAYLVYMGSGFCDESHAREVEAVFAPKVGSWIGGPRTLDQVLEGIAVCEATTAAQAPGVREFLAAYP